MTPAERVLAALTRRRWTIATCESVTGGLVVAALVSPAGASAVVRGGLVTYATDLKSLLAGVDERVIATDGVVSARVAAEMAEGARRRCGADVGVATTGVAGPAALPRAEVGTVWVAAAVPGQVVTRQFRLPGDRDAIRTAASTAALEMVAALLEDAADDTPTDIGPSASPAE